MGLLQEKEKKTIDNIEHTNPRTAVTDVTPPATEPRELTISKHREEASQWTMN